MWKIFITFICLIISAVVGCTNTINHNAEMQFDLIDNQLIHYTEIEYDKRYGKLLLYNVIKETRREVLSNVDEYANPKFTPSLNSIILSADQFAFGNFYIYDIQNDQFEKFSITNHLGGGDEKKIEQDELDFIHDYEIVGDSSLLLAFRDAVLLYNLYCYFTCSYCNRNSGTSYV